MDIEKRGDGLQVIHITGRARQISPSYYNTPL